LYWGIKSAIFRHNDLDIKIENLGYTQEGKTIESGKAFVHRYINYDV
jgi:hypothetical protein